MTSTTDAASLAAMLSARAPLRDRFRALGDAGVFERLARPETIERGCRELARLAHAADDLGTFISLIAAAGLGVPLLERGLERGAPAPSSFLGRLHQDALAGRAILAVAITERDAGSDVAAMKTAIARRPDGSLRLDGGKWHVTNAPEADAIIVFAIDTTTDDRFTTAVVVSPRDPGVRALPALDLIGCHGSPTGALDFTDVTIAEDRVLGRPEDGGALLALAFLRERVLAPWPLLGKMQRAIEESLDHVERRAQFGRPIHEFQYVQDKIVSSFDEMLRARHLAERAVRSVAGGRPELAIASLAKAASADAALHVFRAAIEVHGSYGVQADRHWGEWVSDALCAQIAGGTRETHKKVVFGELRLERARARRGRPSRLLGSLDDATDRESEGTHDE